ncbi:MAG: DNA-binding protein [Bacteroidetes bacterium CG2_30_33_31]|nr:MAG: DNA-binding protein [Bacteroidetes bacterium CG2_30_33_31]
MNELVKYEDLEKKIISIRQTEVILDRDIAFLFNVETRALKQAVKRNISRFPLEFMFELSNEEMDFLVSQSVIPHKKYFGGAKPFAFSEQGVAMLSAVLNSPLAIEVSIKIMKVFVQYRKVMASNKYLIQKLDNLETRYINFESKTETRFEAVFNAIEKNTLPPKEGVFYEGQIFDAYVLACNIIKTAKKSIVLIDNYIDESVLTLLTKRQNGVIATIFTKAISKQLELDIKKHNQQYPAIEVKVFSKSHDRFLIIDNQIVYHIGASLKDLGKNWVAFSKMNLESLNMINKLGM